MNDVFCLSDYDDDASIADFHVFLYFPSFQKKFRYGTRTVRRAVSAEITSTAAQLNEKSHLKRRPEDE